MNNVVVVARSMVLWIAWVLGIVIRAFGVQSMRRVAIVDFEVVGRVIFLKVFLISGCRKAIGFICCQIGPMRSIVFHVIDKVTQFWGWNRKLEIRG